MNYDNWITGNDYDYFLFTFQDRHISARAARAGQKSVEVTYVTTESLFQDLVLKMASKRFKLVLHFN